ncbi:pentapeptide repeat-containing protein [Lentzea jiangxiensis]|nr:pentapeptide repeat-containing protein [Lentzea jiangxiensis]
MLAWLFAAAGLGMAAWIARSWFWWSAAWMWLGRWWTVPVMVLLLASAAALGVLRSRHPASPPRLAEAGTDVMPALTPRAILLGGLVLLGLGITAAALLLINFAGTEPRERLDAIRTAATLIVGTGGAAALLLAARRQRAAELTLAVQHKAAADTAHDAAARRITELYLKAVEQLGSDKAAVRHGGLYALERVAQDNPNQRQTVINVICAYLRSPYTPVIERLSTRKGGLSAVARQSTAADRVAAQAAAARRIGLRPPTSPVTSEQLRQEREVRLTAQRILTSHLCPGLDRTSNQHTDSLYWAENYDLDLTGATLIDFRATNLTARKAAFTDVHFSGDAEFSNANFTDDAEFSNAKFTGGAEFSGARFTGRAWFSTVAFTGDANFRESTFIGNAEFIEATFISDAEFSDTTFAANAWFNRVKITEDAWFGRVKFNGEAVFSEAKFTGNAWFDEAKFAGNAEFGEATFNYDLTFTDTEFTSNAWFNEAKLTGDADFSKVKFNGEAEFSHVTFTGDAEFNDSTFVQDAIFDRVEFSGDTTFRKAKFVESGDFGMAIFMGPARFDEVKFVGDAWFNKAIFAGDTWFDQAIFTGRAQFDHAMFLTTASMMETKVSEIFDWCVLPTGWTIDNCQQGAVTNNEGSDMLRLVPVPVVLTWNESSDGF